ncbi:hypothetical protein SprV_0200816200 [Sparganum proliferum]
MKASAGSRPVNLHGKIESSQTVSNSSGNAEDYSSLASPSRLDQNHSRSDVCPEEDVKTTNVAVVGDSKPITDILPGVDQKLRKIRQCPIPQDGFLSPYLASDLLLSRLPPLGIVVSMKRLDKCAGACTAYYWRAVEAMLIDTLLLRNA